MMAWRLKASPYKNAAPKLTKKEEWIPELTVGNLMQTCGNHIKASCAYMAFNVVTSGGGNLGILPVSTSRRLSDGLPQLPVHGDVVTDFDFSPFDDYLLATGSADNTVKVLLLPWQPEQFPSGLSSSNACRSWTCEKRVENVTWNPLADGILAVSTNTSVKIYDVEKDSEKYDLNVHKDQVQSVCWNGNGGLLATSCKDKFLRILDPRTESVVQEKEAFGSNRDSRVMWVGSNDAILTTGFDSSRNRKVHLWDSRNLASSLYSLSLDTSTGTLMPLYDSDTKLLFLIGKGDTSVKICEVKETSPYIVENYVGRTEQVKGAALVPKRVLNVMDGEVDRLLLLTSSAVIPTPIIVPRKSYRDFHEILFPDTPSGEVTLSAMEWLAGQNGQVKTTSLNPAFKTITVTSNPGHLVLKGANPVTSPAINGSVNSRDSTPGPRPSVAQAKPKEDSKEQESLNKGNNSASRNSNNPSQNVSNKTDEEKEELDMNTTDDQASMATRNDHSAFEVPERPAAGKMFKSSKQSKYKHLKGQVLHKSTHITNLRKINTTIPGESDMFHANRKYCVVPLEGAGGLLAVLELNKPDRLPDTGLPVLQHKSKVMDYVWDPFDDNRLVVACDDAKIWVWDIPEVGLTQTMTEPTFCLSGHMEKIYFVRFHPLAKDVLVSSAYDMSVRIWDLSTRSEVLQLEDHPDQVFCAAWSPDGKYLATVSKDGNIRIFNPRKYREPLLIGPGPSGGRGARVVWVLDGQYLFVSGFSRNNQRLVQMFDTANLEEPLDSVELESSPSILIPYYDEDSHTVLLTGRGDSSVLAFEVAEESPYLLFLSIYRPPGLHQALSFLPKLTCDVREVEFAKAYRLTNNSIEPVSFTVPRVRMEYFQDDLFPDTKITWEPSMTSQEWLSGSNKQQNLISLKPDNMTPLSEAPVQAPKASKYDSYNPETYKTDEMKKEELLSAMTNKLSLDDAPLPQDLAEGVDSDEWEDD